MCSPGFSFILIKITFRVVFWALQVRSLRKTVVHLYRSMRPRGISESATFGIVTALVFDGATGASGVAATVTTWGRRSVFRDRSAVWYVFGISGGKRLLELRHPRPFRATETSLLKLLDITIVLGLWNTPSETADHCWGNWTSSSVGSAGTSFLGSLHHHYLGRQEKDIFTAWGLTSLMARSFSSQCHMSDQNLVTC